MGIATLILDAAKGYLAAWIGAMAIAYKWVVMPGYDLNWTNLMHTYHVNGHGYFVAGLAALFAILGHMYPVWLKFKGGRGCCHRCRGAFSGDRSTRSRDCASNLRCHRLVLTVCFTRLNCRDRSVSSSSVDDLPHTRILNGFWLHVGIVAFLIIFRHKENIRRLLNGTESKFGAKKQTEASA